MLRHKTLAASQAIVHRGGGGGAMVGRPGLRGVIAAVCAMACLAPVVLAGCGRESASQPSGLPVGGALHVLEFGGMTRGFRTYRPAKLATPAALVVMLHGGLGSAAQAERSYRWNELAESAGFVVVYPDGAGHAWNAGGGCCGNPGQRDIDDTGFITRVVQQVRRQVPIAAEQVYAAGMSNGGMMAYELACRTTLFAAIGPVAATQTGSCEHPNPVSVIHIHGDRDPIVPYGGGPGQGGARINGPGAVALSERWRHANRCAAAAEKRAGAVTTLSASCPDGRAVQLWTLAGGGHQWPGTGRVDATQTIWEFFAAHPGPQPR